MTIINIILGCREPVRVRGPVAKLKLIQTDGDEPGVFSQGMYSSNLATSGKQAGKRGVLIGGENGKKPILGSSWWGLREDSLVWRWLLPVWRQVQAIGRSGEADSKDAEHLAVGWAFTQHS